MAVTTKHLIAQADALRGDITSIDAGNWGRAGERVRPDKVKQLREIRRLIRQRGGRRRTSQNIRIRRADLSGTDDYLPRSHPSIASALVRRDRLRSESDHRKVSFDVVDTDDPERGTADWCENCGSRGTFTQFCGTCEAAP